MSYGEPLVRRLFLAAAVLLSASPLGAQAVSVRVISLETADPVTGAVVRLLDGSGTTVGRGLTNLQGRALLLDVAPGSYRLRAEMIGMASLESEPFEVAPGATVHREMRLEASPIDLRGIEVEVAERCRVRPEEGLATQRVWDEARKALEAAELTDARRAYRYRTMMYERDLEDDARTVVGEERSRRVATLESPFRSRPVEELAEHGYVEPDPEGDLYFAPDAGVLLSEVFLDTHCFRVRHGGEGETEGLLGLAFEPVEAAGGRVEVSGTLWLDPATSELRWLDYGYENLDPDIRTDEVGGRVEFRRMPDGGWIVPRWWIRMPSVAVQRAAGGRTLTYVAGYREAGGMVLDVEGVGSDVGARAGTIEGVVTDSLGAPLRGVSVEVLGAGRTAVTDGGGRYRVGGLLEGTYRVRFEDERLRAFGHSAQPLPAEVGRGRSAALDFRMPSAATVLLEVCGAHDPGVDPAELPIQAIGDGVLAGRVVDAETGEAIPDAVVRVITHRYEFARGTNPPGSLPIYSGASVGRLPRHETRLEVRDRTYGLVTRADGEGFYRVCHVPARELLTVIGIRDGVETEGDTVKIEVDGGVREHTVVIPRKR